jgi:hypothetical protein
VLEEVKPALADGLEAWVLGVFDRVLEGREVVLVLGFGVGGECVRVQAEPVSHREIPQLRVARIHERGQVDQVLRENRGYHDRAHFRV